MRVGITGHQRLDNPADWQWVEGEIRNVLDHLHGHFIGITSLAIGADQLFARLVLQHGGQVEVIVPFDDYERTFADEPTRSAYRDLLHAAGRRDVLKKSGSDEEAFFAAGKLLVDRSDLVIAVWNGKRAAGLGGTADIVHYARDRGKGVIHLNPGSRTVAKYPSSA